MMAQTIIAVLKKYPCPVALPEIVAGPHVEVSVHEEAFYVSLKLFSP